MAEMSGSVNLEIKMKDLSIHDNFSTIRRPKNAMIKRSSCFAITNPRGRGRIASDQLTVFHSGASHRQNGADDCIMFRPASMPGIALSSNLSKICHCIACCNCSPNKRLSGVCPAFSFSKSALMSSVDTGLDNIVDQIDNQDCPFSPLFTADKSSDSASSERLASFSLGGISNTDKVRYSSLPLYYSRTWCKVCGKAVPNTIQNNLDKSGEEGDSSSYRTRNIACCCKDETRDVIVGAYITSVDVGRRTSNRAKLNSNGVCETVQDVSINNWRTGLEPEIFRQRRRTMREWFGQFSHEQRRLLLKDLLEECSVPEIHSLSVEMAPRMHEGCPINCQDWLSFLPPCLSLNVLSFLDPVSLCRASCVCRSWYELSNEPSLWRKLCSMDRWRLSASSEQKQLSYWVTPSGDIHWKGVFGDRYRLQSNWLKGRCNVRTFEGHTQGVSCVQFDDTRIVSGSSDKTIKLWNRRTNSPWAVQTLVGHSGTVRCLHLEANRLVSGSSDCTIKVWDVSSRQEWTSIACKVTMIGHTDTVRCLKVDDEKVISGSYDRTLKVWNIKTGTCLMTLRGHEAAVLCVQFDSNKIVSGSCDKTIKVWTMKGQCVMTLEGHHDAVTCLQFDDTRIISGSLDCTLRFWDVRTGTTIKTIDWKASEGHTGVIRCLQADSWRVVSASDDRTIKVWNLETGQRLVTLRNHTDGVTCLQFNDNVIVSGSYDKSVKLWDFSSC